MSGCFVSPSRWPDAQAVTPHTDGANSHHFAGAWTRLQPYWFALYFCPSIYLCVGTFNDKGQVSEREKVRRNEQHHFYAVGTDMSSPLNYGTPSSLSTPRSHMRQMTPARQRADLRGQQLSRNVPATATPTRQVSSLACLLSSVIITQYWLASYRCV